MKYTVAMIIISLSLFAQTAPSPIPDIPTDAEFRERVALVSMYQRTQEVKAARAHLRVFAAAITVVTPAPAPPPPWYTNAAMTVPDAAVRRNPVSGFDVALSDQTKSDADNATRWAVGANAKCACPFGGKDGAVVGGYDWLIGNAAAYRGWAERSGGENPIDWLCKQGYDSPLASYAESWTINRTSDELAAGLTEAVVTYNGKDYPAQILPTDCLAGCKVYARVACAMPHTNTVIALRKPGAQTFGKCVWLMAADQSRGGELTCPSGSEQ